MRALLYAHTLNVLTPRGWLAGSYVLVLLLGLFSIATNSRLEGHLISFFCLIMMVATFAGSTLLLIERAPLSFCLPGQQRVLRPMVMLVGLGSCTAITALTLKLLTLNEDHALYAQFLAGPVFSQLVLQGLALYFLMLSLQLAIALISALKSWVMNVLLFLLLPSMLFFVDVGFIQSPATAATGAAASAALCWWLLGLRSVARYSCQGSSPAQTVAFQINPWQGSALESMLIRGIRRFRGHPWGGAFFESLYLALGGTTARNMLFALLGCLYITVTLVLNFRETHSVRVYDFLTLPLMPLCFPIFSVRTMFSPWLPVSRAQRFVRLLVQGAFHYLFAMLMALFVRAMLSVLVWSFPDAPWSTHAQDAVDMPLQILFFCGLFALVANFFHAAVPWTLAAVLCVAFIGVNCYDMARWLVPAFVALDPLDIALVSALTCAPFVLACASYSFKADLRERKHAWIG